MEQRLDATYLRPGLIERAATLGIGAVGIGTGVLLAAWGISLVRRYTPPEVSVRIANPEIRVAHNEPITVTQDKPFVLAQTEPLKIEPGRFTIEQAPLPATSGVGGNDKTATGDVITREVTVFSNVKHGPGTLVTGWKYRNGGGGVPVKQYCYYGAWNVDQSSTRVDIASDGIRAPHTRGHVPNLEEALAKCQWWQG